MYNLNALSLQKSIRYQKILSIINFSKINALVLLNMRLDNSDGENLDAIAKMRRINRILNVNLLKLFNLYF